MTKIICTKCEIPKDSLNFPKRKIGGYYKTCKTCQAKYNNKIYYSSMANRLRYLCNSARNSKRTKGKEFEFTITPEFLVDLFYLQEGRCFYSNLPMDYSGGKYSASIDRVNPDIGYTKKNVVLCCWIINHMKKDLTHSEFLSIAISINR